MQYSQSVGAFDLTRHNSLPPSEPQRQALEQKFNGVFYDIHSHISRIERCVDDFSGPIAEVTQPTSPPTPISSFTSYLEDVLSNAHVVDRRLVGLAERLEKFFGNKET